jgi:putative ABC transport system permease protein
MSYALATLWYERQRYLPGVLAVMFSALLIALQFGLMLGLFSITSLPIDHTRAHIWMGAPQVLSVGLGRPIRENYLARLQCQPEVSACEVYLQGFMTWTSTRGGSELCMVIGARLEDGSLGAMADLTPEMRARLTEPGAVVVDESERERLGIRGEGDTAEVSGKHVRVVGMTRGVKNLAGPYVLCSLDTARLLLRMLPGQTTYVLARCCHPEDAPRVVDRLKHEYDNLSVFTSREFADQTSWHWLLKTKAGLALGYAAGLGLLVGLVVTSQTLAAAVTASLRELAVLRALGVPRWRMARLVLAQSFWVGILGVGLAMPVIHGLALLAARQGVLVDLPLWLQAWTVGLTLGMALLAGLLSLRSLRGVQLGLLLR